MGLMLYTVQLLLLAIVLAVFKNTTLFDHRVFALTLVAVALTWVAAQARAHMKAKILYVQPESAGSKSEPTGSQSRQVGAG
jgi:ATP synthase protein I